MPVKREVHLHFSCDGNGCGAKGSNGKLPDDWRQVLISIPSSKDSPDVRNEAKATLCPKCVVKVYALLGKTAFLIKSKIEEVKNVNRTTSSSSGNTATTATDEEESVVGTR